MITHPVPPRTIELLDRTRELLAQGWTQGAWARNAQGATTAIWSPLATCYCFDGAMDRAMQLLDPDSVPLGISLVPESVWIQRQVYAATSLIPAVWNDRPGRTQQEVLDLLDTLRQAAQEALRGA